MSNCAAVSTTRVDCRVGGSVGVPLGDVEGAPGDIVDEPVLRDCLLSNRVRGQGRRNIQEPILDVGVIRRISGDLEFTVAK